MKNIAVIENGIVDNIATWDGVTTWNPGSPYTLVDITNIPNVVVGSTYDGTNFTPPTPPSMPTQTQYENIVLAAMKFGQGLLVQFAAQNIIAGVTQAGKTNALLAYASNISQCLTSGSLYSAIDAINAMIADTSQAKANLSPFITNTILTSYKNQIQTYLGLPLT